MRLLSRWRSRPWPPGEPAIAPCRGRPHVEAELRELLARVAALPDTPPGRL